MIVESSGPLVEVVVPPVALLPFVVIMPPVKVVVHSVALLPLAAVMPRRRAAAIVVVAVESRSIGDSQLCFLRCDDISDEDTTMCLLDEGDHRSP